jgi:hypothetical protein
MSYKFSYGTSFFSGSLNLGGTPTSLSASHEIQAGTLAVSGGAAIGLNVTLGGGLAADSAVIYDGNAKDFYVGLDDSADKLVVGVGQTLGTNTILTLDDDSVTIGDGAAVDTKIVFDGNAQDYYIGLDDSADDLVIGLGSAVGTTPAISIDENQAVVFPAASIAIGDGTGEDTKIIFDGNAQDYYIGLDDSADDLVIGLGSAVGTTPAISIDENQAVVFPAAAVTIGDGTAEDTKLVFDGNAQDFYVGLDDSADMLVIGSGSNASEQQMLRFHTGSEMKIYVGDARPADVSLVFDGHAKDFYMGLDDSADKFLIGEGSTVGTNPILTLTDDTVTIGDGAAVDNYLIFDGNSQDYRIGVDHGTSKLEIGHGNAHGTRAAIIIDSSGDITQLGTDSPSTNEVLTWDGSKWVAAAAGSGGTSATGSNMGQPIPLSPALPLSGGLNYGVGNLGSSITVTLPASGAAGDTVIVKGHQNLTPSVTVTVDGAGSDTIDGEAVVVLQSAHASVTCVCIDGGNWVIV